MTSKEQLVNTIHRFVLKNQSARMMGQNTLYANDLAQVILDSGFVHKSNMVLSEEELAKTIRKFEESFIPKQVFDHERKLSKAIVQNKKIVRFKYD